MRAVPVKVKYVLAGESFATKKALTERVRSILHNVRSEVMGQDFALLSVLVSWHPSLDKRVDERAGAQQLRPFLLPLFTEVRGTGILRSSYAES
jgi:hypothetical protein